MISRSSYYWFRLQNWIFDFDSSPKCGEFGEKQIWKLIIIKKRNAVAIEFDHRRRQHLTSFLLKKNRFSPSSSSSFSDFMEMKRNMQRYEWMRIWDEYCSRSFNNNKWNEQYLNDRTKYERKTKTKRERETILCVHSLTHKLCARTSYVQPYIGNTSQRIKIVFKRERAKIKTGFLEFQNSGILFLSSASLFSFVVVSVFVFAPFRFMLAQCSMYTRYECLNVRIAHRFPMPKITVKTLPKSVRACECHVEPNVFRMMSKQIILMSSSW